MGRFMDELKRVGTDVFKRSAKGVDAVASVIDEQAELGRLGLESRRKNRERDDLVMAIGRKVYTLYTLGKVSNAELVADCQAVDRVSEEVAALQGRIDAIRRGSSDPAVVVEVADASPVSDQAPAPSEPPIPPQPPVPPEPPVPPQPPVPPEPPVPPAPTLEAPPDLFPDVPPAAPEAPATDDGTDEMPSAKPTW
jgi:hypothetical protein